MSKKWFHFGNFLAIALLALVFTSGVSIGYSYFTAKWLLLYAIGGISVAWLLSTKSFPIPKLKRVEAILFLLAIFVAIGNTIWLSPSGFENSLLDRLTFLLCVLFSYTAFERKLFTWNKLLWPVIISCSVVSVYGLCQISEQSLSGDFPYTKVGSLFGYSNNTAQFLGICLVYLVFRRGLKSWASLAQRASCVLGISYVFLSQCRSVYLGLLLVAIFVAIRVIKERRQWLVIGTMGIVSAVIMFSVQASREGKFSVYQPKELLTSFRVQMAKATLFMIKDHPFGVGVDLYEYKALPYLRQHSSDLLNEDFLAKSPHNEVLRYLVEDGIPASILFFLALLLLLYRWWKRSKRFENAEDHFVFALGLFYLVEMGAQFPFQNPLPVFIFSLCIAWIFFRCYEAGELKSDIFRPIFVVLLLAQCSLGYFVVYSRLNEKSTDLDSLKLACSYLPSNWHACLLEAKLEMQQEKVSEARHTLENLLQLEPDNLIAMRNLSLVAFHDGKIFQRHLEGCYYLWRYVDGYAKRTPLVENLKHNCPERWINYFETKRPKQFYQH